MKRLLLIVLVLVILIGIGIASGWYWLTSTTAGAQWALGQASNAMPSLAYQQVRGDFAGGLVIDRLELDEAGVRVSAEQLRLAVQVRPGLRPEVRVRWVDADRVRVELAETEPDPEPAEPLVIPDLTSPIPVQIDRIRVTDLDVLAQDQEEAIRIERIEYRGALHERLEIERLEVDAELGTVRADGHWELAAPHAGRLRIDTAVVIAPDVTQNLEIELNGSIGDLNVNLDSRGPAELAGEIRVRGLPTAPRLRANLTGRIEHWTDPVVRADELEIRADGTLEDWRAEVATALSLPDLPESHLRLEATGDTEQFRLESLRVLTLGGEINARGQFALSPEPVAGLRLDFSELELSRLVEEWPERARLEGSVRVEYDGDVRFDNLQFGAPPSRMQISGSGHFSPATDQLALDLEWQELAWPLLAEEILVSSQRGRLSASGALGDWQMELESVLEAARMPTASIMLEGRGDLEQARIERMRLDTEAGSLSAEGQVAWAEQLSTELAIELLAFDPGQFMAELPGQIDGRLQLAGSLDPTPRALIEIESLSGRLRGQPLAGQGRLDLRGETAEAAELALSLGDNRLAVETTDGKRWDLELRAERMDQLWPTLAGQAEVDGWIDLADLQLAVAGQLGELMLGDISIARSELDARLDWADAGDIELALTVSDADLRPWDRIDQLELNARGNCRAHQVELDLGGTRGTLSLAAGGGLNECFDLDAGWQGELTRLYLGDTVAGNWRLARETALSYLDGELDAGPACLRAEGDGEGRLCLESLRLDHDSHIQIAIDQVPMDLLLLPADPVFSLTTPLSGTIRADWDPAGLVGLEGKLALAPGGLRPLGGEEDLLSVEGLTLDFGADEDSPLVIQLDVRLEGQTRLEGEARVADLRDLGSAELSAQSELRLPDIGAFNRLVPQLDQLGGSVDGRLRIEGQLLAPEIGGRLAVHGGEMFHAPTGMRITDLRIDLVMDQDSADLSGYWYAGEGRASLIGEARRADRGWAVNAEIDGDDLQMADVDWLRLRLSPQVRLAVDAERVEIDGDIRIKHLRGGLPPGSADRVAESPDVRVLGENDEDEETALARRQIRGRLGLHMGDDARLAAIGLQTSLAGGIEMIWEEEDQIVPLARGTITLPSGFYRAYGQNLEIEDGQIMFTGHPIDNPRLDIQARRTIFGDPQVEFAGVLIRGSAQDPRITLFTDPPTTDEKALAYVVTGADFDHAGGQGAVNLGFYLLPRLFVSYGIGLFETGNVLSARYELSRRWGLRATSGERDTGLDLSFAIDR